MNMHAGFVALTGRPNVGKSTLLNAILGEKVSITSRKPQTTRHQILGILTEEAHQIIFIDTPGIHQNAKKALNRYMNRTASSVIEDVDLILHLVEAGVWTEEDEAVAQLISDKKCPRFLVINKVDKLGQAELMEFVRTCSEKYEYHEYIPVSALKKRNIDTLTGLVKAKLPESPMLFPAEQVTDKDRLFMVTELIREKLLDLLHKEIPYSLTVQIEKYEPGDKMDKVSAVIWAERDSQKSIVIGKKGSVLKQVGEQVRRECERRYHKKFFIKLWVKVKEGWTNSDQTLGSLGYTDL